MIVTGILTALALEHVVVAHTHALAAQQSQQRIVEEIRFNLTETRAAFESNKAYQKKMLDIQSQLKKDILDGESKQKINSRLLADLNTKGFAIELNWPVLRHESWDVAVANQSASYIEPGLLRRYSAAYSARESATTAARSVESLFIGSRTSDAITDLQLQRGDPADFLKMLANMNWALSAAQNNIAELQKQLEAALAAEASISPTH